MKNKFELSAGNSDQLYGLMMALFSIGLILGTWLIGYYEKKLNRGYLIYIGLILQGFFLLIIYFEPSKIYTSIVLLLAGLTSSGAMTPISAFYAENTTNKIRGRVYSVTNASIKMLSLFGFFLAGIIIDYIGVENLFLFIGLTLIISTVILTYSMNGLSLLKNKVSRNS